jgi:hypothetical protein
MEAPPGPAVHQAQAVTSVTSPLKGPDPINASTVNAITSLRFLFSLISWSRPLSSLLFLLAPLVSASFT